MDRGEPVIGLVSPELPAGGAPLTRRRLLANVGAGIGGSMLLAACGSLSSSTPSNGSSKSASTSGALAALPGGTPKRGGTFTVGVISGGQEENLFPGTSVGTPDFVRDYNLYNLLFYLGKDVTPLVPGLALSAEPNADASVWTFKLRDGVTWHDGKPFTADDVVYNFQSVWSNASLNYSAGFLTGLVDFKNVRKLDSLTVQVPLTSPAAQFPTIFAYFDFPVVQEGATAKTAAANPVGTGPFKFSSFTPGSRSVFTANKDYWESGKPYVDELVVDSSFTDTNSLFNALLQGTVNLFPSIPLVTASGQLVPPGADPRVTVRRAKLHVRDAGRQRPVRGQPGTHRVQVPRRPPGHDRRRVGRVRHRRLRPARPGHPVLRRRPQAGAGRRQGQSPCSRRPGCSATRSRCRPAISCPAWWSRPRSWRSRPPPQGQSRGQQRERGHLLHPGRRVPGPPVRLRGRPARRVAACRLPVRVHDRVPLSGHALGLPVGRSAAEKLISQAIAATDASKAAELWRECQLQQFNEGGYLVWGNVPYVDAAASNVRGLSAGAGSATTTGGCVMAGSTDRAGPGTLHRRARS